MRNFLNPVVHTVFVMLGPRCNLKCRYCLQRPLREDRERDALNPEVIEFIRDIARNQVEPVTAHFYGGSRSCTSGKCGKSSRRWLMSRICAFP